MGICGGSYFGVSGLFAKLGVKESDQAKSLLQLPAPGSSRGCLPRVQPKMIIARSSELAEPTETEPVTTADTPMVATNATEPVAVATTEANAVALSESAAPADTEGAAGSNAQGAAATTCSPNALCSPTALPRAAFLTEPGATKNDFGLTSLDGSQVTAPEVNVAGNGRVKPTNAALPNIRSVYIESGKFVDPGDTTMVFGQEGSACPTGIPDV